jgi:GT2 family glycosyltransferase
MSRLGLAVPTYNRPYKLKRFLQCLAEQSFRDFSVYLVDSGYNSKTVSDMQEYAKKIDLIIIPATPKHWWAAATNMAVRAALRDRCDLIMTINDDAIIKPDFLEKMVELFEKYNCRMLGARIDFADRPGTIWSLGLASKWGDSDLFGLDRRDYHNVQEQELPRNILEQEIVQTQGQCGDGLLIEANVFKEIGLYHEKICPQGHSDREHSFRAQFKGIKIWCATNVVLYNDVYNDNEKLAKVSPSQTNYIKRKNWRNNLYDRLKKISWLRNVHGRVKRIWESCIYSPWKRTSVLYKKYFRINSSYYVWPVLYICLKYAPRDQKFKSVKANLSR